MSTRFLWCALALVCLSAADGPASARCSAALRLPWPPPAPWRSATTPVHQACLRAVDQAPADQALQSCSLCQCRQPSDADCANALGVLAIRRADAHEARRQFRRALLQRPEFAAARTNLAELELREQDPEEAVVLFRSALQIEPDDVAARLGLAQAHAAVADRELERALRVSPTPGDQQRFTVADVAYARAEAEVRHLLARQPARAGARELLDRIARRRASYPVAAGSRAQREPFARRCTVAWQLEQPLLASVTGACWRGE